MRRARTLMAMVSMATIGIVVAMAGPSSASEPPSSTVIAPPPPGTVTVTWTGTIPPGGGAGFGFGSSCNFETVTGRDEHTIDIQIPAGFYDTATTSATFKITWDDAANDEALTVNDPDGEEVGTSDGSEPEEVVEASDLVAGSYEVLACPFSATTSQNYTGELTFSTTVKEPAPPVADSQGLSFSATVAADPQRDEAEPDIRIDDDGVVYACGPSGFSNATDYAQVSTDGGDQFHLIGEEPRGQQGSGGGGDCGLGLGNDRNADGKFDYTYTGLGPLTGFTTSTSADNGHNLTTVGPQGNLNSTQGAGVDRQWNTFLDGDNVLLSYNQQQTRNIVVQKSTNGGLTYVPGDDVVASPSPLFPGPMRSMPAELVGGEQGKYVAYYGWNDVDRTGEISYINFAISDETGLEWNNCRVTSFPFEEGGEPGAFTVADHDRDGNIYLTYADKKGFHSYLTTLTVDKLKDCTGGSDTVAADLTDPGWSEPVQVDRGAVRSTVFPWLAAGGEPGRVAVTFYGTETDGDPNRGDFKATWDIYVNQSLNALDADPQISQVKATTHPFHYDSICLRGLDCDLSQPPGDRSLADFFAIDYNPKDGRLYVVYDQGAKKPDDASGRIATPAVIVQEGGPSNGGGTVEPRRPVLRDVSNDPAEDAIADYSSLFPGPPASETNVPALDFLSQSVGPQTDLESGAPVANGGFDVTMKIADVSDAALERAVADTKSGSLVWIFRFVNGYQASAANAYWSPVEGFSFGFNDYTTGSVQCGSSGEKCQLYPGDQELEGKVDQEAGTITLSVPSEYLRGLSGSSGPGARPAEVKAGPGTRFYDATAYSLANPSPDPRESSFLQPIDNPPAMDFLLGGSGGGTPPGGGDTPGGGDGPCSNRIEGTGDRDKLGGTKGSDRIVGRQGNDSIKGRAGDDCLLGKGGNDKIAGNGGGDNVRGGGGKDKIKTQGGGDVIRAGRKADKIKSGGGKDTIRAARGGRDVIDCGPGKDKAFINDNKDRTRRCEKVKLR